MPVQRIKIKSEDGTAYSPYTGEAAFINDGVNDKDRSLAFVYLGNIGDYSFVADHYNQLDVPPLELTSGVDIVVEVDAGWSGVNYFGYVQLC